ncbi:MAG: glycosyltransferase, partial [Candidatus Eremiobacteraeota bacterium]|nr:glycosyltransferase [Candidatus Eremiobacteraeota bacterium]
MMKLAIITPAYNAGKTLHACVRSIANLKVDGEMELVVVDDGSADETAEIAEKLAGQYSWMKVIRQENRGEAAALNTGLDQVDGDFIGIIEADVEVKPDWLIKLLPAFDDPEVMAAGGYLVTGKNDPWIARLAGYEIEEKFKSKEKETVHLTSANVLYRAEAFKIAGRFTEQLLNASLDAEFNSRLLDKGYKLIYVPSAKVIHHYKPSFIGYLKRQFAYARYRAHLKRTSLYPADRWVGTGIFLAGLLW